MFIRRRLVLPIVGIIISLTPAMVLAQSDSDSEQEAPEYHPINSIDALHIGKGDAHQFARAAEYCVQNEQYDKAIKLSKMAIDRNDDDNEIHQVYAEALEGKLQGQVDKDPMIFNQCVKEWLIVLRQEVGDEKLTYHGIGIPGLGHLYADEERVIPARKHLVKLTGRAPKAWETDDKYLKKVLKPSEVNVTGKVVRQDSDTSGADKRR